MMSPSLNPPSLTLVNLVLPVGTALPPSLSCCCCRALFLISD